jgi:uncharacterized protein YjbJ (UPF0337 family)
MISIQTFAMPRCGAAGMANEAAGKMKQGVGKAVGSETGSQR